MRTETTFVSPSVSRHRDLYDLSRRLILECQSVRSQEEATWDQNYRRYLGQHFDKKAPQGLKHFVLNLTQNAIIANVAVQTEQRPRVKISPRTPNNDAAIYLTQPAGAMLAEMMQNRGMQMDPNQAAGFSPLGQEAQGVMDQANVDLGPDEGWEVNDALVADVIMRIYDTLWSRSGMDFWLSNNILNTSIIGTQPLFVQWNQDKNCYDLKNIHVMNVWIDPIATCIEEAEYVIIDWPISAEQAKAMYPEFAPQIDAAKSSGKLGFVVGGSGSGIRLGSPYRDTTFQRDMVIFRTMWKRNEPVPLSVEEALATGAIIPLEPGTSGLAGAGGEEGEGGPGSSAQDSSSNVSLAEDGMIGATTGSKGNADDPLRWTNVSNSDEHGNDGTKIGSSFQGPPNGTMRTKPKNAPVGAGSGYGESFHTAPDGTSGAPDDLSTGNPADTYMLPTGALTSPDNDNWPTRIGILQVQAIAETILLDVRECPYKDIPCGWNNNITVPYRPWGQGEPERLEDAQQVINRVLSILHNHLRYFQSPDESMPQSMKDALKANQRQTHAHPGRQRTVPDDLWMQFGGKVSSITEVPQLPPSYVDFLSRLIDVFKSLAGNVDVLQGDAKADWSGKLVQALQGAARGPIGFKSTNTERMIEYLTKIMIGMILDFLPETEWVKICPDIPVQVLREIRRKGTSFEYEIEVEVVSGKGVTRQVEQEKYMSLANIPPNAGSIDVLTLLEKLEVPNAKGIVERLVAAGMIRDPSAPMPMGQPGPGGPGGNPGQPIANGRPPSNNASDTPAGGVPQAVQ